MQPKEAPKLRIPRDRLKAYSSRPVIHKNNRSDAYNNQKASLDKIKPKPLITQAPVSKQPLNNTYQNEVISDKIISLSAQNVINNSIDNILKKHQSLLSKKVVYACAIFVCLTAIFANVAYFINNNQIPQQAFAAVAGEQNAQNNQNQNGPDVSEDPIEENTINSYIVAPDLPKKISIESLGIKARILRMGTDSKNQIQSPTNSFDAGWYDGSNKPGENGAVFVNGHVSGPTKAGIFYNLKKLNAGDIITIEKGDGTLIKYQVVTKETIDINNVDMQKALRSIDVDKQGLNLMTCSGDYSSQSNTFNQRLIVYSVRI